MPEAYVIEAVRTAIGKRNGGLSGVHPVDLGAAGWRGLFDRVDVDRVVSRADLGGQPVVGELEAAEARWLEASEQLERIAA